MKKLFLDDLPRHTDGRCKGKINWSACIGHRVKFQYNSVDGYIKILQYTPPDIMIRYNEKDYLIATSSLLRCSLGILVGEIRKEYLYGVDDIINSKNGKLKVLEQIRLETNNKRGYKYECQVDNYIGTATEYDLKNGHGCPVCANKVVKKGINDIHTLYPELDNYFVNIEDAYKYSECSDIVLNFKCPDCGYKKNTQIKTLIKHSGFICPQCGDGKSYPEKFIMNFLKQLDVNFIIEYKPKWITPKRYDYYLPDYKIIIEVHGEQHYTNSFKISNAKTLNQEIENDKYKYKKALENGINNNDYVVIDARYGDCEWLKNSIIKSNLNDKFDISRINWKECNEFATSSIVRDVCDIYNSGIRDICEIADNIKMHRSTVVRYLNKGFKLGWCDYSGSKIKEMSMRKIICLNNLNTFQSIKEASRYINKTSSAIHAHLRGETKSSGKHPETGEPLRWMYYDDYIKQEETY